jgi:hypothetical protein
LCKETIWIQINDKSTLGNHIEQEQF